MDGGKTRRKAHKASARLDPYQDPEETASELIRRASNVAEEHKWVVVRAMAVGDSQPIETVAFPGEPDPDEEEDGDAPKGPHAAAEALARVAMGQHRMLLEYAGRLESVRDELTEMKGAAALYKYHSEALQLASKDGMVARVAETLGPELMKGLPEIVRIAAAYASEQPIPPPVASETAPEDPAGALAWHVDRIVASAVGLRDVVQGHGQNPAVQAAGAAQLARLRQVVMVVAPLVGLQVVQPQQQAAPPPPPPADETPPTQESSP